MSKAIEFHTFDTSVLLQLFQGSNRWLCQSENTGGVQVLRLLSQVWAALHTTFIIANRLQCLLDLADMEEEVALHMWEHPHKESLTQGRTLICPSTIKTIPRL